MMRGWRLANLGIYRPALYVGILASWAEGQVRKSPWRHPMEIIGQGRCGNGDQWDDSRCDPGDEPGVGGGVTDSSPGQRKLMKKV
jgi:hypothetical protein